MAKNDLRGQLKATSIKKLKKRVEEDDKIVGASGNNEYLNLVDGKTLKIRIFPAHPGNEDFYVPKKCYWLTITNKDGEERRTTVLDSKIHGGTKYDIVEEYVKFAKQKWSKDTEKMNALIGTGMDSKSLNPQYTWLCYAGIVDGDEQIKPKVWEFKKMVRDLLNKLAFSEDDDDVIEVDPFTDVDEGLPINVKFLKNPNKKKGENYYDVTFPKKVTARPLTDEEIETFMELKPLTEVLSKYGNRDFDRALEGLQNFDEENEIGLFEDDNFLERVEEVKAQYDDDNDEDTKTSKKSSKPTKKVTKKVEVEEEEEEDDEPKSLKSEDEDEFDDMDREELKKYIRDNELDVTVKKSMSDDDIRNLIREEVATNTPEEEEVEEEEEEEEDDEPKKSSKIDDDEKPKSKISLEDIRNKIAKNK